MTRFLRLLAIVCLLLGSVALTGPAAADDSPTKSTAPITTVTGKIIPDQYIVVLKDGASPATMLDAMSIQANYVYDSVLNGFAAHLDKAALAALQQNPNVAYIEPDQVMSIDTTQSPVPSWGLDRIDQRNRPLNNAYTYNYTGAGVTAYIIDTGLQANHPNFGGRAANVYDAFGGNGSDCHGHGTHVGGTVGGSTYGVAKGVTLRGVRVLNCSGSGSTSGIIAGLNWVNANSPGRSVANMSLGGGFSSSLNSATTNLANSGVFVAVAAGNSSANACNASPASASNILTVAASDSSDRRASFSNYGSCVELYAPGVSITSAWLNSGSNTISGTSMASPHVAGVGALYKQRFGEAASSTVNNWIISNSTANVISSNPSGTPNRLLYAPP